MQNNMNETKNKIISIIRIKGPSLPTQIASQTGLSSIFAGALLSELFSEQVIRISNMKVGGSPLYFIPGQESSLDNFYQSLPGKEKEAFLLLKERRILEDKSQEPAIRVALRSIKDFAVPFKKDEDIFWRFHSTTEEEVRKLLEPRLEIKETKPEVKETIVEKTLSLVEQLKEQKRVKEKKEKPIKKEVKQVKKEEPLDLGLKPEKPIKSEQEKQIKPKETPEFVKNMLEILKKEDIEPLEEKEAKKKEFSYIVSINTDLGKMKFLCMAKDKKRINENDLKISLQEAQALKMPALVVYTGEIVKKAIEYADSCSLIKLKKVNI